MEEERGEEAQADDAPDPARNVRVVTVPTADKDMLDGLMSEQATQRRRWMVTPLRRISAKTSS